MFVGMVIEPTHSITGMQAGGEPERFRCESE
jgi:hypothetical protein